MSLDYYRSLLDPTARVAFRMSVEDPYLFAQFINLIPGPRELLERKGCHFTGQKKVSEL